MLGFRKSRSAQRASERADEAEQMKARLSPFLDNGEHNPVKDQIADLKARRNSGSVNASEYAAELADLLGTSESALGISESALG